MSSLSTVEAKLPPGFRFHPRDDELICDYLMMKWITRSSCVPSLIQVDLNKCEPWDIPETACVGGKEWYFYSQRDRKYATGSRTNRATESGYWKATGKDQPITRKGTLVGMRKTLVFYQGRAPKGKKTEWIMHEFRLEGTLGPGPKLVSSIKEDWVLCRVFYNNRSEINRAKQEPGSHQHNGIVPPSLMEPYKNIAFYQTHHQAMVNAQYHDEQVPCFSIFTNNQTNLKFSPQYQETSMPTKTMPNFGGLVFPDMGINYNSISTSVNDDLSSCDTKMIKAVLNHLTKMETCPNDNVSIEFDGSPRFGEVSSNSYMSEMGMSSIWNQYS